jgi:hypothetical protein
MARKSVHKILGEATERVMTPQAAYTYCQNWDPTPQIEAILVGDPELAINHALTRGYKTWPALADAILKEPDSHKKACWGLHYVYHITHEPWPEIEPFIAQSAEMSFDYAHAIGRRFPLGEEELITSPGWCVPYFSEHFKGRWPEAEPFILEDKARTRQYLQLLNAFGQQDEVAELVSTYAIDLADVF